MEMKFCHSCGIPIGAPNTPKARGDYCEHCTDETGALKPKTEVEQGIAMWLKGFSPNVSDAELGVRAQRYLSAMPAWAE